MMNINRREQLITLCVPLALCLLFYLFVVQPHYAELKRISVDQIAIEAESKALNEDYLKKTSIYEEVRELKGQLKEAIRRIPQKDIGQFEAILLKLGSKYQLIDSDETSAHNYLRYGQRQRKDNIIRQPVQIRFVAESETFISFLNELENREILTEVNKISVQQMKQQNTFDVSMHLNFFYGKL